ncbi:MAG: tRNA epoxyqueuosine(34) reductase QueG [candidate division KSB1 bacterium]|nr:tRNA epoxyqueuosine(34) reductase QueG [candidate division KSB1 bacterium]
MHTLGRSIKARARELGFCKIGIAAAAPLPPDKLDDWLSRNHHGSMGYMQSRRDLRLDVTTLVPGARSVIVLAMNYYTDPGQPDDPEKGVISRYAWGDDYHDIIRARLKTLLKFIQETDPQINGRVFVDSAPVMEKVWAVKAGLGWIGKHSNLITPEYGSWVFLGEVIIDAELEYDEPFEKEYCGTCTRCLQACPTGAIVEPQTVDARRCISYLTIELKPDQPIPEHLQPRLGNRIFGCDACQEVCPWNRRRARVTAEKAFYPRPHNLGPALSQLKQIDPELFERFTVKSPLKRSKYAGLMRNIKVALKNAEQKK